MQLKQYIVQTVRLPIRFVNLQLITYEIYFSNFIIYILIILQEISVPIL